MPSLPEHFHPSEADSAGQSWSGRSFSENPFRDDDGTAPAEFLEALRRFRAREAGPEAVVDALREARVLIPLVARLGEADVNAQGVTVDKSADLSIVTVAGPDGRTVLPVFTSAQAMKSWNPAARPVPALMQRAAISAAAEGSDLIVVDATSETEFVVRRPAVWAIAQEQEWAAPWTNPVVTAELSRVMAELIDVRGVDLVPGDPEARLAGPELRVVLHVAADVGRDALAELSRRASELLQGSESFRAEVDSLGISFARSKRAQQNEAPVAKAADSKRSWWRRRGD
ncbi:MAG: SseB family protein [Pseudoclavibacter sp.]